MTWYRNKINGSTNERIPQPKIVLLLSHNYTVGFYAKIEFEKDDDACVKLCYSFKLLPKPKLCQKQPKFVHKLK